MEAIFCYGLAFCDSEWSYENSKELDEEQKLKFGYHKTVWDIVHTPSFQDKMKELDIIISGWTFEDCGQLLLAHKDLFLTTYDIEIVGKMSIKESETDALNKALSYFVERVKEDTDCVIDFHVEPSCILAVDY